MDRKDRRAIEKEKLDNKKQKGFSIGTSLVLVTFVLLALVTFATISYVQARSDLKLTNKALESSSAYYEANTIANEKLAKINDEIIRIRKQKISFKEAFNFRDNVREAVSDMDVSVYEDSQCMYISYGVVIDDTRSLLVEVRVEHPNCERITTITKWQISAPQGEEPEEEPLNLLIQ